MSDILDLDTLEPRPITIKIGGQEVEVQPASNIDLLRIGALSNQIGLQLYDNSEKSDPELDKLIEQLKARLVKIIPELKDRPINIVQAQALVERLNAAATPEDVAELEARGVSVGDPKAPSA